MCYEVVFDKNNCTIIITFDESIVFTRNEKSNVYKINFLGLAN